MEASVWSDVCGANTGALHQHREPCVRTVSLGWMLREAFQWESLSCCASC
jgi:hypothetical protein